MTTGPTILLVEDEVDVRDLVREMLTDHGYNVIDVGSGPEALAKAEQLDYQFDLLMTDVVMPKMNGAEVAEELGKILPGLRVLYMSGYLGEDVVDRGVLDADIVFLDKPFSGELLLAKVREALAREPVKKD